MNSLNSKIEFDIPHASAPLMLRKERDLYLALIQVAIEATRVFDAIAEVTETSDFLHSVIVPYLIQFVNPELLFFSEFFSFRQVPPCFPCIE